MKHVYLLVLAGWWWGQAVQAQAPQVRFSQLPAPLQLFPRDTASRAEVPVSGRLVTPGYPQVSLQVFRNNALFSHQRQALTYDSTGGRFSFKTTIRAELAEYRFDVYAHRTATDSVRLARRDSVVCGDVFLINGQSNATTETGMQEYIYRNEFHRTFGRTGFEQKFTDTLWTFANRNGALVGVWGQEVQRLITETYRIPVCILNGGVAGTDILFQYPNLTLPEDLSTSYGRLLYRAQRAGLQQAAKAMFWRQGEAEAFFEYPGYAQRFEPLYRAWKRDYPALERIYVFQNNIIGQRTSKTAGEVLEFQRRSPELHSDVVALATVGLPGYDGTHFNAAGYVQSGRQLFRLVARDFYRSTDLNQINSPTLRKAFYTSPRRDAIRLVFDEGQALRWPADSSLRTATGRAYTRRMVNYIYLDGKSGNVQRGEAQANQVTLTLTRPDSARRISYLPAAFRDSLSNFYDGPHLRNGRGLAAFAFQDVALAEALPTPDLRASSAEYDTVQVSWTVFSPKNSTQLVLERSDDGGRSFRPLANLPDSLTSFVDTQNLLRGFRYVYRLRSVGDLSESLPDTASAVTPGFQLLNINAKALSHSQVQLDWTATVGPSGFRFSVLERSTRPDSGFAEIARLPYPTVSYTDSLLRANTVYFYRVRVINGPVESAPLGTNVRTMAITGTEPVAPAFRLFPNPTRQTVTVEWTAAQTGHLLLTDALGVVRLRYLFQNLRRLELPLPHLAPGLYLFRAETATGTLQKKLLVE